MTSAPLNLNHRSAARLALHQAAADASVATLSDWYRAALDTAAGAKAPSWLRGAGKRVSLADPGEGAAQTSLRPVDAPQRARWQEAADRAGRPLAEWAVLVADVAAGGNLRTQLRRVARR